MRCSSSAALRLLGLVVISLALLGAKVRIRPPVYPQPEEQRVLERNYEIGVERTAFVGEAVVSLKDYVVLKQFAPMYKADRDFTIRNGGRSRKIRMTAQAGDRFVHVGTPTFTKTIDGIPSSTEVIQSFAGRQMSWWAFPRWALLLIDEDGKFTGRCVYANRLQAGHLVIEPKDTRFVPVVDEAIIERQERPYFEIVYTGRSDSVLTFMYREYTFDDFARPAFTQQLMYPSGTETVRFKAVQLRVHDATPEHIAYTVTADGSEEEPLSEGGQS